MTAEKGRLYEPCVVGSDGNCTRWSHNHSDEHWKRCHEPGCLKFAGHCNRHPGDCPTCVNPPGGMDS